MNEPITLDWVHRFWQKEFEVKILPAYLRDLQNHKCFYCGKITYLPDEHEQMTGIKTSPKDDRTEDHVIPKTKGGSDDPSNKVTACRSCNSKKYNHIYAN